MTSPAAAIADLQPRGTLSGVGCLARRLTPATPARPLFSALPRGASGPSSASSPFAASSWTHAATAGSTRRRPRGGHTRGPSARPSTCAPGVCQRRNRRAGTAKCRNKSGHASGRHQLLTFRGPTAGDWRRPCPCGRGRSSCDTWRWPAPRARSTCRTAPSSGCSTGRAPLWTPPTPKARRGLYFILI